MTDFSVPTPLNKTGDPDVSYIASAAEQIARYLHPGMVIVLETGMPRYWVQKVQDKPNDAGKAVKGSHILVLGVAYKKNVSDLRESPALDIIHLLEKKGAHVAYHDPHAPAFQHDGMEMAGVTDLDAALAAADCVVIVTDHDAYDWTRVRRTARLLVDTRHVV